MVADDVKLEFGSDLLVDFAPEGEPLLMAMARGGVSKYLAGKVVQSGKESNRSMPVSSRGCGCECVPGPKASRATPHLFLETS